MKRLDLCAMGNGVVDVLIEVSDAELADLGWAKGSWGVINQDEVEAVTKKFADREQGLVSGGSVANSLLIFEQLGGKGVFLASLGDDKLGKHFANDFKSYGVTLGADVTSPLSTGCCISLISPDAERTMRICLGAAEEFNVTHIKEECIAASEWLFIEGYLFSGGEVAVAAIEKALDIAKKNGTKVAVTTSAVPIVENHHAALGEVLTRSELVFANEAEAQAYAGVDSVQQAVDFMADIVPNTVVTVGAEGAYICCDGAQLLIPAFPCTPVDLTGAGDAFAGSYLYGVSHGYTPKESGMRAARMSKEIIMHKGARYLGDSEDLKRIFKQ